MLFSGIDIEAVIPPPFDVITGIALPSMVTLTVAVSVVPPEVTV
jgi:hypothetical protein